MSILINRKTPILVQGITGMQASFHTKRALGCGTNIVSGVAPGRNAINYLGVPVFSTVKEAVKETGAEAGVMFVPAPFVKNAAIEAIEAGLKTIVAISSGVPIKDMMEIKALLKNTQTTFIGPNTPGVITPEEACLGIFPENIHKKGNIGIVSKSSTLTYEAVLETKKAGLGQSTVVGLGDDMIIGTGFVEILSKFEKDEETKAVILIGSMGGTYEEQAADYYAALKQKKPVIAYIAGSSVPLNEQIGYAGDIITRGKISAEDKKAKLKASGMIVAESINELHLILEQMKP